MTRRRAFLIACAASIAACPLPSSAQQKPKLRRIGYLAMSDEFIAQQWLGAFRQSMKELGYLDGRDYTIEARFARGDLGKMLPLAQELAGSGIELVITAGTPNALAMRESAPRMPIVMVTTTDPVRSGLVESLAHPGGNITGLTSLTTDIASKRLELLREIIPTLRKVGFLYTRDSTADRTELKFLEEAGGKVGVRVIGAPVTNSEAVAGALTTLKQQKAEAVIVTTGGNFVRSAAIIEQTTKHRLPAIFGSSYFVENGGLMSYATDWTDQYRRAATYVDKIWKGAKPGDLPIEQPTKFELVINMKTAKALGIKIPQSILVQADNIIR